MSKICILLVTVCMISCHHPVDVEKVKEELIQADLEFAKLSLEKGKNFAFLQYIDGNGVILRENAMPVSGKDSLAAYQSTRPDTNYTLQWKPLFADAAESGEMGYTFGVWLLTNRDTSLMGTYATVWKRDENGNWKYVLDAGNDGLGKDLEKYKKEFKTN
jgi:ketosteroid isomerase-like protein